MGMSAETVISVCSPVTLACLINDMECDDDCHTNERIRRLAMTALENNVGVAEAERLIDEARMGVKL